jgi:hypothetical protein
MDASAAQSPIEQKITSSLGPIIDKHKSNILPLLGKSSELSVSDLNHDQAVRTVATYCYALLPGLVRLAVKEPTFIDFVMANRHKLLGKLIPDTDSPAAS